MNVLAYPRRYAYIPNHALGARESRLQRNADRQTAWDLALAVYDWARISWRNVVNR
jgi:hypothetical protein